MKGSNPMQEIFEDPKKCLECIVEARKIFSNKNTTKEQYEKMQETLASGYLYAPVDIKYMFTATLDESAMRKLYFNFTEDK
jgi:hypothetical protein